MEYFENHARHLQDILRGRNQIGIDIEELVGEFSGRGPMNFYPSNIPGSCHQNLIVVAIEGKLRGHYPGHLSFAQGLDILIKHMTDICPHLTTHAAFITNVWKWDSFNKRREQITSIIDSGKDIECYLIGSFTLNKIKLF